MAAPAARASDGDSENEGGADNERTASVGAGGRLTHLLRAADPFVAAGGSAAGNSGTPETGAALFSALEQGSRS